MAAMLGPQEYLGIEEAAIEKRPVPDLAHNCDVAALGGEFRLALKGSSLPSLVCFGRNFVPTAACVVSSTPHTR